MINHTYFYMIIDQSDIVDMFNSKYLNIINHKKFEYDHSVLFKSDQS